MLKWKLNRYNNTATVIWNWIRSQIIKLVRVCAQFLSSLFAKHLISLVKQLLTGLTQDRFFFGLESMTTFVTGKQIIFRYFFFFLNRWLSFRVDYIKILNAFYNEGEKMHSGTFATECISLLFLNIKHGYS